MTLYWKVHIKDFESFVKYLLSEYKYFSNELYHFKNNYDTNYNYLYLFITKLSNSKYRMTFSDSLSIHNTDTSHFTYMGEFNGRKEKLKFLNEISEK